MARAKQKGRYSREQSEVLGEEIEREQDAMENGVKDSLATISTHAGRVQQSMLDAFDVFGGPVARVLDHNHQILQKMMHAVQEESVNFVNRRLEHTSHAIESSRDCQGVSGLIAVQQEWMMDFASDYAEHTRRFAELMRELAEEGSARFLETSSSAMEKSKTMAEDAH